MAESEQPTLTDLTPPREPWPTSNDKQETDTNESSLHREDEEEGSRSAHGSAEYWEEEKRSRALPLDIYDRIKNCLVELQQVTALIEEFKSNKMKETIQSAASQLDDISQRLESLVQVPEAQSRQNGPLLLKLYSGIEKCNKEILQVTCHVNKSKQARETLTDSKKTPSSSPATPTASESHTPSTEPKTKKRASVGEIDHPTSTDAPAPSHAAQTTRRATMGSGPPEEKVLQGYLRKQGEKGMKRWCLRWFRQVKNLLYYFVSESATSPSGHIDLYQVLSVQFPKVPRSREFQLVTANRIYRLQALSASELEYWRRGLRYWRTIFPSLGTPIARDYDEQSVQSSQVFDYTDLKAANQDVAASFQSNALPSSKSMPLPAPADSVSEKSPQSLGEALEVIFRQQRLLAQQNLQIEQLKQQQTIQGSEKERRLLSENEKLLKELELKESLLDNFEEKTFELKKEVELYKKIGKNTDEEYVNRLVEEIKEMEKQLRTAEDATSHQKREIKFLTEKLSHSEQNYKTAMESLGQLRMEMKGKDQLITKLTIQAKHPQHDPFATGQGDPQMRAQYQKLREVVQAHQTQNAFLASEVARIETEGATKIRARDQKIERLEMELDEVSKEFQEVRKRNLLLKGADESYMKELEQVKKALFYAIGVGIKMQLAMQERPCNVDIQELFYQAQHIHWKDWNEWITQRINETDQLV